MERKEAKRYIDLLTSGNERIEYFLQNLKRHNKEFAETAEWNNFKVQNARYHSRVKDLVFTGECEIGQRVVFDGMVNLRMTFDPTPPHFPFQDYIDCIPDAYADTPEKKREILETMGRFLSVDVRMYRRMVDE